MALSLFFLILPSHEFDTSYGPAWHCIVGTNFGSYVTHSVGGFLYFSINKVYVLLFKTSVEPMAH
ncbi:putative dynein ATPase [Helianthus annuus]|nr:putative dynein ATPase [Helianthus annuus]